MTHPSITTGRHYLLPRAGWPGFQKHWCPVIVPLLVVLAAACGGGGHDATEPPPPPPPPPVPAHISIEPSDGLFTALGDTTRYVAIVTSQNGDTITNNPVTWSSSNDSVVTAMPTGLVTSVGNGTAQIGAATGSVSAHTAVTVEQMARFLFKVSGDSQTAKFGQTLPAPLIVRATDANIHPVSGATVTFSIQYGLDGSVSPPTTVTDSSGRAQARWTLGYRSLVPAVMAQVASRLGGDNAAFSATALPLLPPPVVTGVSPDTLIEGEDAIFTGANFSLAPDSNVVVIDGAQAQVLSATSTSLKVTVPAFPCRPVRLAGLDIQVGLQGDTHFTAPIREADTALTLAVGQEAIITEPARFCLHFGPSSGPPETYLMGLSAPAESPGVVSPFEVDGASGLSSSANAEIARSGISMDRVSTPPPRGGMVRHSLLPTRGRQAMQRELGQLQGDARIRAWEAAHLARRGALFRRGSAMQSSLARDVAPNTPAVGDTLTLHVPNLSSTDLCTNFQTIRAVVRVVGRAGIWVQDVANPTMDSLTQADIQTASDEFDTRIYATDTTYFGHPSDIDGNGRVIVALTWQVNKTPRILGFVFLGDLAPLSLCSESNGAEIYYGEVPDPDNVAQSGARTKATVLAEMPQLIAHEVTHVIQFSQRVILNDGTPMATWEMEGQATLAEELVGHATLGNAAYQNYGADVAFSAGGIDWYEDEIVKLTRYFGDLGAGYQASNAPDQCSVYGNLALRVPCDVSAFYGASWILQRYISDQYGPTWPGGPAQLTRDWISKNLQLSGTANIGALLGVNYDSLFVRFATALALDDRDNGTGTGWLPRSFQITSWNSASLATYLAGYGLGWLSPPSMTFSTTSGPSRGVRGGSTAYTLLEAQASHPAMSFRVFSPVTGLAVDASLRPALWVVRIQ